MLEKELEDDCEMLKSFRSSLSSPELNKKKNHFDDDLPDDVDNRKWYDKLSDSEKAAMHLARAFIMNPEVVCFQRPTQHFHTDMKKKVLQLLGENTENRGIGMSAEGIGKRRPRSVFFTVTDRHDSKVADACWKLPQPDYGFSPLDAKPASKFLIASALKDSNDRGTSKPPSTASPTPPASVRALTLP